MADPVSAKMKLALSIPAMVLGGLHLGFCALFFAFYFASHDPQKGMALSFFVPVDPWTAALSRGPDLGEVGFAFALTTLGTAQWWAIGFMIAKVYRTLKREPNQPLQPNADAAPSADEALPPRG